MGIKERIAVTGRPGVGKTTLIERVIESAPSRFGGFVVKETLVCGRRVGFRLIDIGSGREGILAHIHQRVGPRVGKYTVNSAAMDDIGIPAVEAAIRSGRVVVIDEFAPMELLSPGFVPVVEDALASDAGLLIATHATLNHPLVHRIRQELRLFRVKVSNRDRLADELITAFGEGGAEA